MTTMLTLNEDTTVLYSRTPYERAMEESIQLMLDAVDRITTTEWDDLPTQEPINISTGVFHEWGYYGWGDDTRHRTTPKARKNRATK